MDKETNKWVRTVAAAIAIAVIITMIGKPVIVKGKSMEPTYEEGDWLVLNKIALLAEGPKRNDFVVFTAENELKLKADCIKRVIGIPGDAININRGNVYINNELLYEDYIAENETTGDVKIEKIPEGFYFVLGDNRGHSLDSRNEQIGLINIQDIRGKIVVDLFK